MKLSSSFGAHQSLTHSHRPLTQHKPGERRADREETDSSNIHKYHIWKQTARKCQAAPRVTDESPARLAQKRAPVQHVLLNFVWIDGVLLLSYQRFWLVHLSSDHSDSEGLNHESSTASSRPDETWQFLHFCLLSSGKERHPGWTSVMWSAEGAYSDQKRDVREKTHKCCTWGDISSPQKADEHLILFYS